MTLSVHDLAPQTANLRAHWVAWGGAPDPDDALVYYRSGLQHPMLNGVLRLRDRPLDEAATEVERRLAGLPWRWWVGPDSDPGVAAGLAARGYVRRGAVPIMAMGLDRIPEPPLPDGLTIARSDAAEYVGAYAGPFGVPPELLEATVDAERRLRTDLGTLIRLVGRVDGRAVAAAAVLLTGEVAGLYWIATDAAHRQKGIAAALTAAAMAAGREHGGSICTLQASSLGEPVYRRLGFATVAEIQAFTLPAD
ncbi:acetyltransferase [Virgisporangium aliadipatigenens]|uniref:Acetyltransferase n=1 Tax=Virgisporangium aliadipatigenens TaxID=741659 RepID=A0A8J4DQ80_9ACTN|nr:GNAT family N-acetyltransferase [Virgisporangium aliadipatigenens]GIJ45448.1 acetyltransferase [Virgisporangium aliadipatigenens]